MMTRLRTDLPAQLAGSVVAAEDLLPRTDAVVLTGPDLRVVVRPSGTEPKLKCYLEVVAPAPSPAELDAARAQSEQRLTLLRKEMRRVLLG